MIGAAGGTTVDFMAIQNPPRAPDELFTPRELARILNLTESTLYLWRRDGKGPNWFRLPTGRVRYKPEDVEAWLGGQSEVEQ